MLNWIRSWFAKNAPEVSLPSAVMAELAQDALDRVYSKPAHYRRTLGSLTKAQIDARNAKAAETKRRKRLGGGK